MSHIIPSPRFALGLAAAVAALILVAGLIGWRWSERVAAGATNVAGRATADAQVALLESELQKFRLLPVTLVEFPDVANALGGDRRAARRLDASLEGLAQRTGAEAIYVVGRDGVTVAASNYRSPESFVGRDYASRPYFAAGMRDGRAEVFGLGTVSRRPGLYLAGRVAGGQGLVVVKVEFDRIEASWRSAGGITLVVDPNGIVLVSSRPEWRFGATRPLSPAVRAATTASRQFGPGPPRPIPIMLPQPSATTVIERARYRSIERPVAVAGAGLVRLEPLAPALASTRAVALGVGLAALVALLVASGLGARALERRRMALAAQARLEAEVADATTELRRANTELRRESAQRASADRRYRAAREELAQASRLASIGQITAGVAHEINQPVAAIRTFSENLIALLRRGDAAAAERNAGQIVALTERLRRITDDLRQLARRRTPEPRSATVADVLEGVTLLLADRAALLRTQVAPPVRALRLAGDRVRIEQILVNLLTNAFEAAPTTPVTLEVAADGAVVAWRVRDQGAGVPAHLGDELFAPFVTGKANGLGLGLAIARDLARGFGGDLVLEASGPDGATFLLTLPAAT